MPVLNRYLDPLSDFGFKYLFNQEDHKEITIDFLNALFEGQKHIVSIFYSPTEYAGAYKESKKVFFDLLCTADNGEKIIIEMQRNPQRYFSDRCIFYLSRLISGQIAKGKSHWNTELKEIYLIGILEFRMDKDNSAEYLHDIHLADRDTKQAFSSRIGLKFMELPNFNKAEKELLTELDKWFYLFKHLSTLDKRPEALNSGAFKKIFEIAEIANLTKAERMKYDSGLKAKWDYENTIAYAAEEAKIEGKIEGAIEGELKIARKIALQMMLEGDPLERIARLTKLSLVEIEKLKPQYD